MGDSSQNMFSCLKKLLIHTNIFTWRTTCTKTGFGIKFVWIALAIWEIGKSLNVGIMQSNIVGFISTHAPKLFDKSKVSIKWTQGFLKTTIA